MNPAAFKIRIVTESALTDTIERLRYDLRNIIDLNFGLLSMLQSMDVLSDHQIDLVEGKPTYVRQVDQLLAIVICLPSERQNHFLTALQNTQVHVKNFINSNGNRLSFDGPSDEWPLAACSESNLIRRNFHELIENMDPLNGLLDELLSQGCNNVRHKEFIETRETRVKKNESILNILLKRSVSDFNKFIHCLEKTKQHQVISLLKSDVTGINRPLGDEHKRRLLANYSVLISLIDTRQGLLTELLSADCITRRHKEFIESAASQSESNKRLLDIVMRGSQSDFEKFIEGLVRSGQQQVCRVLREDAIVVHIVAKLSGATLRDERTLLYTRMKKTTSQTAVVSASEIEERFVKQFKQLLLQSSMERRKRLKHEMLDFLINLDDSVPLIGVKTGSIVLCYLCTSLAGVKRLYREQTSGRQQQLFSRVVALLVGDYESVEVVSFDWSMTDYLNCIKYVCPLHGGKSAFANVITTSEETPSADADNGVLLCHFDRFPLELVETVLAKSVGKLYTIFNKVVSRAEDYALATLSAVSNRWWLTLTNRKCMKHLMLRYFKRVCNPFKSRPHRVQELNCGSNVCGVSEFNNRLYVACYKSNTIQVFNSSPPFSQSTDIKIQNLKNPRDIFVCVDTSQLYTADDEARAVWRVNLLSYKQVDKFISTQWQPWSLSIKSRRLLITPRDGRALFIYGDDGVLLSNIELPDYLLAQHALETTHYGLSYIVSHRSRWTDDTQSEHFGVSEIDTIGQVVRTFNSQQNDIGSIQFNEPQYLTLTGNNHVIVADLGNEHRSVCLLTEDLKLKRVMINSSGGQPIRTCFSQRTGLLYIASFRSCEITIYNIA